MSAASLIARPRYRGLAAALGVCLLFAAAVLPSLSRLDFFDGVEHFNLATVQEMRRDEAAGKSVNWMLPTLQGQPRVVKPPLAAWVAAALVRSEDVAAISAPQEANRERAIEHFVFLGRIPTLVCALLLLLGVYVMGTAVADGDWRIGATAALVCAGTILFFQQGRRATTDLQLALWVTWTNALLAVALFRGRIWLGFGGAGIALGLAAMAKGPHIALLMTIVPMAVFAVIPRSPRVRDPLASPWKRRTFAAVSLGALLAIAVGGWWYAYVAGTVPNISEIWRREVLRKDAQIGRNVMSPDPWYAYSAIFGQLLPWTGWVLLGGYWIIRAAAGQAGAEERRAFRRLLLPLCWMVLPIVVMSFFAEKKERYLLPFASPAAVIAGWAIVRAWDGRVRDGSGVAGSPRRRTDHWLGIAAGASAVIAAAWLAISVAIAGAIGGKGYQTAASQPWFSIERAVMLGIAATGILLIGIRRARFALVAPLLAVTLVSWLARETRLGGLAVSAGDADDRPQRALAAEIWQRWPDAVVYSTDPVTQYGQLNLPAIVLSMHLNRVIEPRPATLPTAPRDRPLVLLTDSVRDPPAPPEGWTRFTQVPMRRGVRYVDVLAK
jgi:4-amino-4-deoxy-L-arabinose transferase-like glycosyltransferase